MRLLVLDNYDSFTYNLVHLIGKVSAAEIAVVENDKIDLSDIDQYDRIVLSPGPGLPRDAGLMPEVIRKFKTTKPILGVCLGHQALAEEFGAKLKNLDKVFHGIATPIHILENDPIFAGCPRHFLGGRYHSWVVDKSTIPDELIITAIDDQNEIMAFRHHTYPINGIQFHPESILSECGEIMMRNWLSVPETVTSKKNATDQITGL